MYRVTYKMKDLSRRDEEVQTVHPLLNARLPIVPVAVQDIDVVRSQLLQRRLNSEMQRLRAITNVVHLLAHRFIVPLPGRCVLITRYQ